MSLYGASNVVIVTFVAQASVDLRQQTVCNGSNGKTRAPGRAPKISGKTKKTKDDRVTGRNE